MKAAFRILLLLSLGAAFIAASVWSVRLAIADYFFRQETPAATQQAIEWTPSQSAYYVRQALLAGDDNPSLALSALRTSLRFNPHDGRAWIVLGLRFEAEGRFADAERTLLQAAAVDKTYLPRWTLMNYYFRRSQPDPFWTWARAAVPMIYGDPLPVFHLCGRVDEDGRLIDRLHIAKIELQAAYLFYLLDIGRADLAGDSSRRLLQNHRPADVPLLLTSCDRLLDVRRLDDAAAIWNGLLDTGRLPFRRPDSQITNGDFAVSPTGHGFDWRIPAVEGITAAREDDPAGLRLTFAGTQPEQAEALTQVVPVSPTTSYEFSFRYRTREIGADTGLFWRIADAATGRVLQTSEDLASDTAVARRLSFTTTSECRLVRLTLVCQRRPGATRISGFIALGHTAVNAVPR